MAVFLIAVPIWYSAKNATTTLQTLTMAVRADRGRASPAGGTVLETQAWSIPSSLLGLVTKVAQYEVLG